MVDPTLPLPGLSPVSGKSVIARFDGGRVSSDGGLLVLREVEARLGLSEPNAVIQFHDRLAKGTPAKSIGNSATNPKASSEKPSLRKPSSTGPRSCPFFRDVVLGFLAPLILMFVVPPLATAYFRWITTPSK